MKSRNEGAVSRAFLIVVMGITCAASLAYAASYVATESPGAVLDPEFEPEILDDLFEPDFPDEGLEFLDGVVDDDGYAQEGDNESGPAFMIEERTIMGHMQNEISLDDAIDS